MAGTTQFFGVPYPTSTDYVKDGATAIEAVADGFDSAVAIPTYNAQTGTTYTFVLADTPKTVTASNAASSTYTIPPQTDVAWQAGTTLRVLNLGAGVVTFAAGSGVTVTNTAQTLAQYQSARLVRTGSDAWTVTPDSGSAGGGASGLTLIAAQAIGTAVSSVTVSNCFSATYDSYQVFINDSSASTTDYISLRLGVSGTPSTASYDSGFVQTAYSGSSVSGAGSPNANRVEYAGRCTAFFVELDCKIIDPFTIKHTRFHSQYTNGDVGAMHHVGLHRQTTSYNDLIVISNGATMTGGTIRVYGYQNS
jgi:hypothetical protein